MNGYESINLNFIVYFTHSGIFSGNSISEEELKQKFGASKEMMKSAACALEGRTSPNAINIAKVIDLANQVAGCGYEYGTGWGKQVY